MIAHVAAAGERSGRVVLWLGGAAASRVAIEAALQLAQTFQAEIESLYVEDRQLFDLAEFPFARAIGDAGGGWQPLPQEGLERQLRFAAAALHRQVAEAAAAVSIPCHARVVRDEPMRAVARACAENGPWNLVVVGEPLRAGDEMRLCGLFEEVRDTTGAVITGPLACRTRGPVVAVVEEFDRLGPMLKTAQRLAAVAGGDVKLTLAGDRRDELAWMEGEARLLCAGEDGEVAEFETVLAANDDPAPLAAVLQRYKPGFALAQYGGRLVAPEASLRPLAAALECPLLLVR
jgi:nucleotide-binding universal stress UspA family protein